MASCAETNTTSISGRLATEYRKRKAEESE